MFCGNIGMEWWVGLPRHDPVRKATCFYGDENGTVSLIGSSNDLHNIPGFTKYVDMFSSHDKKGLE